MSKSRQISKKETIRRLKELGAKYNYAELERLLFLPQHYLRDVEHSSNKMKPEDKALINILYCFPWILNIANCDFKQEEADKIAKAYLTANEIINMLKETSSTIPFPKQFIKDVYDKLKELYSS